MPVIGFFRETEPDIYKKGFIAGVGSHNYKGQEVPKSVVCNL